MHNNHEKNLIVNRASPSIVANNGINVIVTYSLHTTDVK